MNKQTIAILALTVLGGILTAGLAFGDLSGEAAWATLGAIVGGISGILAPSPN